MRGAARRPGEAGVAQLVEEAVNPREARERIMRAVDDYDDGTTTRETLAETVTDCLKQVDDAAYAEGREDEEVLYEAEIELEELEENDDEDDEEGENDDEE